MLDFAAMDGLISMRDAIGLLEKALMHEARGSTSVSPKFVTEFEGGAMRMLFAADSNAGYCAIKAYHNVNGAGARYVVLLYSLKDGALVAVLDGSLITDLRTGAASGVAARKVPLRGPVADSLEIRRQRDSLAWVRAEIEAAFVDLATAEEVAARILASPSRERYFAADARPSFLPAVVDRALRDAIEYRRKTGRTVR